MCVCVRMCVYMYVRIYVKEIKLSNYGFMYVGCKDDFSKAVLWNANSLNHSVTVRNPTILPTYNNYVAK